MQVRLSYRPRALRRAVSPSNRVRTDRVTTGRLETCTISNPAKPLVPIGERADGLEPALRLRVESSNEGVDLRTGLQPARVGPGVLRPAHATALADVKAPARRQRRAAARQLVAGEAVHAGGRETCHKTALPAVTGPAV